VLSPRSFCILQTTFQGCLCAYFLRSSPNIHLKSSDSYEEVIRNYLLGNEFYSYKVSKNLSFHCSSPTSLPVGFFH
jgi:hypothetical protein